MKLIVQRVRSASVKVDNKVIGEISGGLMTLVGFTHTDTPETVKYLADRAVKLRIFEDENGKMNRSLLDVNGSMLIVSQFTLYGDTVHGRRPGFDAAAKPDVAIPLYEQFIEEVKAFGVNVATGEFGAEMLVTLENDGPVTFTLEK
ncbi:MAG: D-tyrosyl-tRNA(Tyr) deacylase [Lentisphaeria bacterium]|nr:D-tyrosyl-tRNA(Tyr) deacylase [Lentisphaerota bacterium]MBR7143861.1 D-tyrosyl-tRNA(Tyr) deacylase [Lentisphaeria bacterium]